MGLLKVHVSDLLPDDEIEYNGEDRCISIDFTEILDITFDLYDNDVSGIYNYRIIINEESLGLVEITFDNYSHFNSVKIAISNMIDGDNDYTITIQFEDTKDYVNCALSIITCIRSVREQVYITGECNVY